MSGPAKSTYADLKRKLPHISPGPYFTEICTIPHVEVKGEGRSFAAISHEIEREFRLHHKLKENCVQILHFQRWTPIQQYAIPIILDSILPVMLISQNGTGKTAAFLLPVIQKILDNKQRGVRKSVDGPSAVVLVPTVNLGAQLYRYCADLCTGIPDVRMGAHLKGYKGGGQPAECDILFTTPGALENSVVRRPDFLDNLEVLVIDEFDQTTDEDGHGKTIRNVYASLMRAVKENLQVLLCSATSRDREDLPTDIDYLLTGGKEITTIKVQEISGLFKMETHVCGENFSDEDILKWHVLAKSMRLVELLQKQRAQEGNSEDSCTYSSLNLIYVNEFDTAHMLSSFLNIHGVKTGVVTSQMHVYDQENTMENFTGRRLQALVTSRKLSRGMNIAGAFNIILFEMCDQSHDKMAMTHRFGRAHRCGNQGTVVVLMTKADVELNPQGVCDVTETMQDNSQLVDTPQEILRSACMEKMKKEGSEQPEYDEFEFIKN